MKRALYFLTVAVLATAALGAPRRDLLFSLMQARAEASSNGQCDSLNRAIDEIAAGFDCVRERCGVSGGSGSTQPPLLTTEATSAPPTSPITESEEVRPSPPPPSGEVQVGTYVPNWFVYKKHYMGLEKKNVFGGVPGISGETAKIEYTFWASDMAKFAPSLTHLYYAFWNLNSDCQVEDSDTDASWHGAFQAPGWIQPPASGCKGLMNDMMGLKSRFPHLKLLISLGGWTYSKFFSQCAKTQSGRNTIVKTLKFYLQAMDPNWGKTNGIWDGVDLDWEFPAADNGLYPDHDKDDWYRFTDLTNDIRSAALAEGRDKMLITCAISVGKTLNALVADPENTKAFCNAMDHINVMAYDIHGKWDSTTGHNAPFCESKKPGNPSQKVWISNIADILEAAGCPLNKLMLGLPNYSPAWTMIPPGPHGNGLFSTSTNATDPQGEVVWAGWSTFSDVDDDLIPQGLISWWDLKETVANPRWGFQVYKEDCEPDHGVVVPLKWAYSQQEEAFACMDDEEVISAKTKWARARGFGGFFFWDAQQDKRGDLLNAARNGWSGLPTHNQVSSSPTCYDSRKPDFSLDPSTGQQRPKICQLTNRKIVVGSNGSCKTIEQQALQQCSSGAVVVGGQRTSSGGSECVRLCSETFGPSPDGFQPWPQDTIFYRCKDETLEEEGSTGGGGSGSGKPCTPSCRSCQVTPNGQMQGITNEKCQSDCVVGGITYWPCVSDSLLCSCMD